MRKAFVAVITELAERDERIVLLTGDLGYLVLESFAQGFPERFLNVGVGEQNMLGTVTGSGQPESTRAAPGRRHQVEMCNCHALWQQASRVGLCYLAQ